MPSRLYPLHIRRPFQGLASGLFAHGAITSTPKLYRWTWRLQAKAGGTESIGAAGSGRRVGYRALCRHAATMPGSLAAAPAAVDLGVILSCANRTVRVLPLLMFVAKSEVSGMSGWRIV
jgi:hypothetical protein